MDPFTERMLERAKIRREKLNGHIAKDESTIVNQSNESDTSKPVINKEFGAANEDHSVNQRTSRKTKLQKLALFYAGEKDNFYEGEEKEEFNEKPTFSPKKPKFKLERLADLATKINQWEDDIRHFRCTTSTSMRTSQMKVTESLKENEEPKVRVPVADKVCSQGYSLSSDDAGKLTYDFQNCDGNPRKNVSFENKNELCREMIPRTSPPSVSSRCEFQRNRDHAKVDVPVSRKVAFFETGVKVEPKVLNKDPAELSLAERKALFENNFNSGNKINVRHIEAKRRWKTEANERVSLSDVNKIDLDGLKTSSSEDSTHPEASKEKDPSVKPEQKPSLHFVGTHMNRSDSPVADDASDWNLCHSKRCSNVGEATDEEEDVDSFEKGGRLYPSLSNLDVADVSRVALAENCENESKLCFNMSLSDLLEMNKNNPTTPPGETSFSKSKECQVLNKMDKLLENALNDLSSGTDDESVDACPSTPKLMKSSSFEYKSNDSENRPLLHTVSFYRRQQQSHFSPETAKEEQPTAPVEDQGTLVEEKIQKLLVEVNKQQTIMSQASQALNLCLSTVEFSGSGEQVEGERLLLLAGHKRQACLNEIQRLKVEQSLESGGENAASERGDVALSGISIKLKRDALRMMAAAESLQYFVCLIKSGERVLATPVISATRENMTDFNLQFPGSIRLESLLGNFRVTIEVYSMELNRKLLPHDIKYHIGQKKEKKLLTPIKGKKFDSKLVKPQIQSPAGPNAVRTTSFHMCGYVVFSLREVNRTQWILNKVPYMSSLEGTLSMSVHSQLRLADQFRGFLTMFDDISGFGAWHRRWCLLSSHLISFWKYPDDEQKKVPIGTIDLRTVITDNVGVVPHDVCARLNTFLLESTRPKLIDDKNSLVLKVEGDVSTIRHLLSADSKQEMLTWCKKLNAILGLLKNWKCNADG